MTRKEMDELDLEEARIALAEPGENIPRIDFIRELGD
jgi:hypothetical protein